MQVSELLYEIEQKLREHFPGFDQERCLPEMTIADVGVFMGVVQAVVAEHQHKFHRESLDELRL